MIKVSVVIAAYNGEKYIEQCIDSILNQTLSEIELICVNDDSKDRTLEILSAYAERDTRVSVYSIQDSGYGAGMARNTGLRHAKGKYVVVLDADDFFEKDMLEKLYLHAERERADLVVFDALGWDSGDQRSNHGFSVIYSDQYLNKTFSPEDVPERIFSLTSTVAWNKFYLRSFLFNNGLRFQENVAIIDDLYFVQCSLVMASRIYFTPEKLLYYRYNSKENQMSRIHLFPLASYSACKEVKHFLVDAHLYDMYKGAFARFSLWESLIELDRMKNSREAFETLYTKLRDEIFNEFDINDDTIEYCEEWTAKRYCEIKEYSYSDYIFRCAFGMNGNTIEVRYAFPRNDVPKGARVALYGAGRIGKMYYAQNLLECHCIITKWVDREYTKYQEKGMPVSNVDCLWDDGDWDYCLIAIKNRVVVGNIQDLLVEHGIDKDKIIWNVD